MAIIMNNEKAFFVKEFTKRTLENLVTYQGNYEVTHLINCAVGLLVVPKENVFRDVHIPDSSVDADILQELQSCILVHTANGEPYNDNCLHTIIRHLRNAVAHGKMTVNAEEQAIDNKLGNITSVRFKDSGTKKGRHAEPDIKIVFEIQIPIEILKRFLVSFAAYICMEKQ